MFTPKLPVKYNFPAAILQLLPVITRMINPSVEFGSFPDCWKRADVSPRLKKAGADPILKNLRPISNLAFISKLTERAVFNQTHEHCTVNNLYPKNQSAYRKLHSTETALLRVKNDLLIVLLDLSSAFDTVDHNILLERLNSSLASLA